MDQSSCHGNVNFGNMRILVDLWVERVRREKKVIVFEVQGAVFAHKLQGE